MTYKVKINEIKQTISIIRLSTEEMASLPIVDFYDEDDADEYIYEYASIISILEVCILNFNDKVYPALLLLDPGLAVKTIFEMYKHCLYINPNIDLMTLFIVSPKKPLLYDFKELIPDSISINIKKHIYSAGFVDESYVPVEDLEIVEVVEPVNEMLLNVSSLKKLRENIVGQDYVLLTLEKVIKRLALGFRDTSRPPVVLLFAGPSGTGKTEVAKQLASLLFGNRSFGRIDCASLSEKHDVTKLNGAPPGYVGYPTGKDGDAKDSDPSLFYTEVYTKGSTGSVLLLDEIEKAAPDIWDIFLTIFDEGYVTTSVGNKVDFRNTIIIMTTNLGTKEYDSLVRKNPLGFNHTKSEDLSDINLIKKLATDSLRKYMKPEIISRITEVIPFIPLSKDELVKITDLEWDKALVYLSPLGSKISLTNEIKEYIADETKDKHQGARPVRRMIEQYVIDPLASWYIDNKDTFNGEDIEVDITDKQKRIVKIKTNKEEFDYNIIVVD